MDGYLEKTLAREAADLPLNEKQEQFLKEYRQLQSIPITPGLYTSTESIKYEVISIDSEAEIAIVKTISSGFERTRTLHWCRKYLSPI